jgi:hypothetical protein
VPWLCNFEAIWPLISEVLLLLLCALQQTLALCSWFCAYLSWSSLIVLCGYALCGKKTFLYTYHGSDVQSFASHFVAPIRFWWAWRLLSSTWSPSLGKEKRCAWFLGHLPIITESHSVSFIDILFRLIPGVQYIHVSTHTLNYATCSIKTFESSQIEFCFSPQSCIWLTDS